MLLLPKGKKSQPENEKPAQRLAYLFLSPILSRKRKGAYCSGSPQRGEATLWGKKKERAADAARYVKSVFGQTSQNQRRFGGFSVSNYY